MSEAIQPGTLQTNSGDLVQLVAERERHFIFILEAGLKFQSHLGVIEHDDLIGLPWGSRIQTHLGNVFTLL
ncbi:MAG: hypothetical protein PVI99_03120, partial [Anaerolineales bacterium]